MNKSEIQIAPSEASRTSLRLRRSKETILRVWESRVRENLPTAQMESTLVLRNALPNFLEALVQTFVEPVRFVEALDIAEVGREHGQQRATITEYSLKAMLYEYSHLREVLIEVLKTEGPIPAEDEATIHRVIDNAVAEAGAEFSRIQNSNQKLYIDNLEMERELRESFVNTLTHDLRNPLSAAQTSAQLIQRRPEDLESVQKFSSRIVECIKRADRMIRDLLDANLLKAGQRLPLEIDHIDLYLIARATVDELSTIHGDRFVVVAQETPVMGYWCAESLRRSIENLASNAVKYGNLGSPITVTLQRREGERTSILVHNLGQTLTPDEQTGIFKQFRRAPSAQSSGKKGWGIGLTIVKGVAEMHGGTVRVESRRDHGTTFTIDLPNDARPFQGQISKKGEV